MEVTHLGVDHVVILHVQRLRGVRVLHRVAVELEAHVAGLYPIHLTKLRAQL